MAAVLELARQFCVANEDGPRWVLAHNPPRFVTVLVWVWRLALLGLMGVVLWAGILPWLLA